MDKKQDGDFLKGIISGMVIMFVIGGLILFFAIGDKSEPESIKDRKETYLSTCDNWEICDYKEQMFGCTTTHCPKTYQCWWESRNCINSTLKLTLNK